MRFLSYQNPQRAKKKKSGGPKCDQIHGCFPFRRWRRSSTRAKSAAGSWRPSRTSSANCPGNSGACATRAAGCTRSRSVSDRWCFLLGTLPSLPHPIPLFLPPPTRVLILHLKRYSFNAQLSLNSKLGQQVVIPRYLTLQSHCTDLTRPSVSLGWSSQAAT